MTNTHVDPGHFARPLVTEQARDRAIRRFIAAPTREDIPDTAHRALIALRDAVIELGALIDTTCQDGRDKSLALTHLEDTHVRAARAIYTESL